MRPAGGCDDSGAGRSTGTCGPAALTLGRQATGGATGAPREFQREQAPVAGEPLPEPVEAVEQILGHLEPRQPRQPRQPRRALSRGRLTSAPTRESLLPC